MFLIKKIQETKRKASGNRIGTFTQILRYLQHILMYLNTIRIQIPRAAYLVNYFKTKLNFKNNDFMQPFKGHLISKWFFGVVDFLQKRTNEFDFTTMIPQVDLFSFAFWNRLKTPKRHFEIN